MLDVFKSIIQTDAKLLKGRQTKDVSMVRSFYYLGVFVNLWFPDNSNLFILNVNDKEPETYKKIRFRSNPDIEGGIKFKTKDIDIFKNLSEYSDVELILIFGRVIKDENILHYNIKYKNQVLELLKSN